MNPSCVPTQAVGSLCAMVTCFVIESIPPCAATYMVIGYVPANTKLVFAESPDNRLEELFTRQYGMEGILDLLTSVTLFGLAPFTMAKSAFGKEPKVPPSCFL